MNRLFTMCASRSSRSRGFSLVELMVGITIALVVTLAIFNVLVASETRKRTTTAVNDINQSGAYSAYILDRAIRSAGSGLTNQWITLRVPADVEGCALSVMRGGAVLLPRTSAFPAPFAAVTQTPRLAPVVIDPGTGAASDVITVMSGTQGRSEAGPRVIGPSVNGVATVNTVGFSASDLVLFGHPASEGNCLVSQVAAAFAPQVAPTADPVDQNLPLGGAYANAVGTANLTGNLALGIGNDRGNRPQFKMYGVRAADRTLVEFDLLRFDGTDAVQPMAEGVVEMRAVYGVDTDDNNAIDAWVAPTAGTVWGAAELRAGTPAAAANLRRIVAVHVALVLRTAVPERDAVPASRTFTLFSGLTPTMAARSVSYTNAGDDRYRYRVIETTIALRNNLL